MADNGADAKLLTQAEWCGLSHQSRQRLHRLLQERNRLEERLDALREALRPEWWDGAHGARYCRFCAMFENEGHTDKCVWRLLKEND